MSFRALLGIAGCAVVGPLLIIGVLIVVLLGLLIDSPQFPDWARGPAWAWMLGTPQPVTTRPPPQPSVQPIIEGDGNWCVTRAYLESPEESHLNAGRVQGYVRDANGQPLAGVPVHVDWDGCGSECIVEHTRTDGYYVAILGPGEYRVTIGTGQSQTVRVRTNFFPYWGHWTWDVDFRDGGCAGSAAAPNNPPTPPRAAPAVTLEPLR
jgi:hypothetical protein